MYDFDNGTVETVSRQFVQPSLLRWDEDGNTLHFVEGKARKTKLELYSVDYSLPASIATRTRIGAALLANDSGAGILPSPLGPSRLAQNASGDDSLSESSKKTDRISLSTGTDKDSGIESVAAIADNFDYPISNVFRPTRTSGDSDGWYVTNYFGHYYATPPCSYHIHPGDDWNRDDGHDAGQPVKAVANGAVVSIRTLYNAQGTYLGQGIAVSHSMPDGSTKYSVYVHVVVSTSMYIGKSVSRGDTIATIANISSFGPHLHFEMRTAFNPNDWYPQDDGCGYYNSSAVMLSLGFIDPVQFLDAHRSPYEGYHDGMDCDKIFGWAWNRTQPSSTVYVNIYYDGANLLAGNVPANQYRPDLPGGGYHAFNYPTPAFLKNGQTHAIRVQISASSQDLTNTPRTFNSTCGGGSPIISVNPSSQNFGSVQVGSSADRNFIVQNVGSGTLSGSTSVPSPFSVISAASYNLTAGQTQTITVRFTPTNVQFYSQNVNFSGGGGATRQVTGTGVGGAQPAQITSPIPGSTFIGSTVTFFWNTGSGVSQYWLYVGNSPGNYDIYNQTQGSNLYATVTGLPTDGRTIYVTLWSAINGNWLSNSYTYRAASGGGGGATNRLLNPSFESGPVNWVQYSSGGYQVITTVAPVPPRSGSWLAYLGGLDNLTEYVYQDVLIPGNATQANVQFYYRITTQEGASTTCYDRLAVEVRRASDNVLLGTLRTLCNYNQTSVWTSSGLLNVWNFRGQTIRLRFIVTTDSSLHTGFFLDDVTLVADGN